MIRGLQLRIVGLLGFLLVLPCGVRPNGEVIAQEVAVGTDRSSSSSSSSLAARKEPFRIEVVDQENGWAVPMVTLRTTDHVSFVSDNAGMIAIDQPELMGREVYFYIDGCGYEVAADGFGYRGVRLTPTAGGNARIEVERTIIAKRLGRLTGGGLLAHSTRLGLEPDWIESGVVGCDSVQLAVHSDRLFWIWGDTTLPHYPLGNLSCQRRYDRIAIACSQHTTAARPTRLFSRRSRAAARCGQDARNGTDMAQRRHQPARS